MPWVSGLFCPPNVTYVSISSDTPSWTLNVQCVHPMERLTVKVNCNVKIEASHKSDFAYEVRT